MLTSEDLQKIEAAVQQVEAQTGGEIVPVLAKQSSFYEITLWRVSALFAGVAGIILTILFVTTSLLLFMPPYLWLLIVLVAGLLGMTIAVSSWPFKRWFLSKELMRSRALDQAKNMFYDHNVHLTEPRTGILIYVSFFEHQAVILADVGISELVADDRWAEIVQQLTLGLKQNQTTESICEAITACGKLLDESGVHQPTDDDNLLSDEVRINE
ncbi:TPM domain-containing protein [Tunicatimonas pelagia]|uniref:TPM domain-containing protein n=1 Tax=Tunicatimonas pelagia TaxID=931531 RepID=UPI002665DDB0|nr:hypothetical protein [Tunicatimonas pelagia]WKN40536.1 hypothetical protein P0M28_15970 [Tunicatimonas pelagia]